MSKTIAVGDLKDPNQTSVQEFSHTIIDITTINVNDADIIPGQDKQVAAPFIAIFLFVFVYVLVAVLVVKKRNEK